MVKNSSPISECLNCGEKISLKYCPYCGQKRDTKRFEVRTIFSEALSGIFDLENFFLHTFKQLLTRPGYFIKDYIKGKRKPYVKPFSFFLFFLTFNVLVFHWNSGRLIALVMDYVGNSIKGIQLDTIENTRRLVEANLNNQYFLLPFIFAFVLRLLIGKRTGINYAESVVFALYTYAMFLFFDTVLMILSLIDARIWLLSFFVSYIYISLAITQFSGCSRAKGLSIGGIIMLLSYILYAFVVFIVVIACKSIFGFELL